MRWPSRMVTVGSRLRKRSRMRALDCATLVATPWRYDVHGRRIETDVALGLRQAGDGADRERHAEDLGVVAVDLILQAEVADLIQTVEAVESMWVPLGSSTR